MTFAIDDPRLQFVPFDREPSEGDRIMRDRWWVTHPERGLLTVISRGREPYASPQCNSIEEIARGIAAKLYPWAEVKFVRVASVPERRLTSLTPSDSNQEVGE